MLLTKTAAKYYCYFCCPEHTFQWREDISWELVDSVQKHCSESMWALGYPTVDCEAELRNMNETLLSDIRL